MSSHTARRTLPSGLPYSLMQGYPTISANVDSPTTAQEVYLINPGDLAEFMAEVMPTPTIIDGKIQWLPNYALPGTSIGLKSLSAAPFNTERPGDPFGSDPGASAGTYEDVYAVTLNYETQPDQQRDPQDPTTFLDYSLTASIELLVIQPSIKTGTALAPEYNEMLSPSDPANKAAVANLNKPKDPTNPYVMVQPVQEFNLNWKQVTNPNWDNIFGAIGKLNNQGYSWLFNRRAGTIMFMGCSGRQEYAYRGTQNGQQLIIKPWQLDLKFAMKYFVEDDGTIRGWNHVYNPNTNKFELLFRLQAGDNKVPLYPYTDFNQIFLA